MKKQLLWMVLLFIGTTVLDQQVATAANRNLSTNYASLFSEVSGKLQFGKPFLQYVGTLPDPASSTTFYRMYGSGGVITTVQIVNQYGAPQSGTASITYGHYYVSGTVISSLGTIHRADNSTFNFTYSEDVS